jgi:hypothetical protein
MGTCCARRLRGVLLALATAVLFSPLPAWAQTAAASLRGTVLDSDRKPAASARVVVRHGSTGAEAQTLTDAGGRYQITGLRPGGPYTVRVTLLGHAPAERSGLDLGLGSVGVQNFTLVAQATVLEQVTVAVNADSRFATSRTGSSMLIDQEAIEAHPTVERNFLEIAEVSPMVTKSDDGALSISGQNERYNTITINGALHQDVFGAFASGLPGAEARAKAIPLDALQEFQVQVAPYDVRASGFTGGLLNAVTKTGTNEWTGSLLAQYRDERFFGDLPVDGVNHAPADYAKQVYAASLGGPLIRDRLHLFVAAETEVRREPPSGFSLGIGDPWRTRVSPDSAQGVASALQNTYGFDPGQVGRHPLENPTTNVFTRLDWRVNDRHTLSVHLNHVGADRDVTPNRAPTGAYEFSSTGFRAASSTQSLMAQLDSRFGEHWFNELRVNVQTTRDDQTPNSLAPQIDVDVLSNLGGTVLGRTVRAGAGYIVQASGLDQTVVQLSNAASWSRGNVTTTFGAATDFYHFDHTFLPGSLGYYRFQNVDSLRVNRPTHYQLNVLGDGEDESVRVTVLQPAAFIQNEHVFPGGLRLYYGLRADVPLFMGRPERNPVIEDVFNLRTDELPSGKVLFSPRLGFNWQSEERYTTQFRGGFGVFTGRLPYVWLANAYANTGLRSNLLVCTGANTPALDPNAPAPRACRDGTTAEQAGNANAVLFDGDFKYPRELKTSIALDQQLPGGFVATGEVLLVQTLRQVMVRDINLEPGQAGDEKYFDTYGSRWHFGDAIAPTGYRQRRRAPGLTHVLVMDNEKTSGFAHAVTLGLERGFGRSLTLGGSYSFNHSDDTQSLRFGETTLNYATNPTGTNPNEPDRAPSGFERPWKTVLYARGRLPDRFLGTQLSLVYIGQAGASYSYVYGSDVNGDGYPGIGIPLDASNDLIFVPRTASDVPGSFISAGLIEQLIQKESCLEEARGTVLRRNACRGPASHRVDAKLVQPVHLGRGRRVEISGSVINALNLLNSDWGRVYDVPSLVPVLVQDDRMERQPLSGAIIPTSRASLRYVGGVERNAEGQMRATLPHVLVIPESQWQAQVGIQFFF